MTSENAQKSPLPEVAASSTLQTGRNLRLIAFYLGVPLVIGAYGALNNWQLLESAGYLWTLAFYAAHALIPWWLTCASTSLAMWGLRSIKPPPYVLMAIGSIVAGVIVLPYTNWLTSVSGAEWQDSHLTRQVAPIFSVEFWRYIVRATIVWFAINFAFDRFLGLPRYRYAIPRGYDFRDRQRGGTETSTASSDTGAGDGRAISPVPGFLERVPARLDRDDVLAIKAEQHYIRVFTPNQEYMVLYRFSDAIRELEPSLGLQVHRSYWISKAAIDTVRPSAKKFSIRLSTGASVPVSTPYHGVVKEFARANQIPIR